MKPFRKSEEEAILNTLGKNLKKLREEKRISQEQLAFEIGLSRSYYTEVETGQRNLSILNLVKITRFLGVELSEILKLEDLKK